MQHLEVHLGNSEVGIGFLICLTSQTNLRPFNPDPILILQRYHGAHVLLHALQYHAQSQRDKEAVAKYKEVHKQLKK